jgi:hypothetical protein
MHMFGVLMEHWHDLHKLNIISQNYNIMLQLILNNSVGTFECQVKVKVEGVVSTLKEKHVFSTSFVTKC